MNVDGKTIGVPAFGLLLALGGWALTETVAHGEQLVQMDERQKAYERRFDEYIKSRGIADQEQAEYNRKQTEYNERVLRVLEANLPPPTPTP